MIDNQKILADLKEHLVHNYGGSINEIVLFGSHARGESTGDSFGEPNYYSLTKYNDFVYFIPIMVPDEIANSQISNIKRNGYSYNIVVPKNRETGFTKITIFKDGFRSVVFFGDDLNPVEQEILIETGFL